CAVSTAADYLRFAQMLMNKGKYVDTRILGRKTVEYVLSNQLAPDVKNLVGNADPTRADYGFGLGLAVRTTPGIVRTMGSVGDFSWPGATGTNWWADPKEETRGRVDGANAGNHPLEVPTDDQCPGLSGDRGLKIQ